VEELPENQTGIGCLVNELSNELWVESKEGGDKPKGRMCGKCGKEGEYLMSPQMRRDVMLMQEKN
jgi:hypothetical protein